VSVVSHALAVLYYGTDYDKYSQVIFTVCHVTQGLNAYEVIIAAVNFILWFVSNNINVKCIGFQNFWCWNYQKNVQWKVNENKDGGDPSSVT